MASILDEYLKDVATYKPEDTDNPNMSNEYRQKLMEYREKMKMLDQGKTPRASINPNSKEDALAIHKILSDKDKSKDFQQKALMKSMEDLMSERREVEKEYAEQVQESLKDGEAGKKTIKQINEVLNPMGDLEKISSSDCKITNETVTSQILHIFCPKCGAELKASAPPMYNPYTGVKICKHHCDGCGKDFNLDHAYPRIAYYGQDGKEITAFGE